MNTRVNPAHAQGVLQVRSLSHMVFVSALPLFLVISSCDRDSGRSSSQSAPDLSQPQLPVPADQVFDGFRRSVSEKDIVGFDRWVTEICSRRLLSDLTRDEIRAQLGKPSSERWTTVDREAAESPNLLRRLFGRKADYWVYSVRPETVSLAEKAAFGLVIHGPTLLESNYERVGKVKRRITVNYSDSP